MAIGYAHVREVLKLAALPPQLPARVRPVTRVERLSDHLAVPSHVAPRSNRPLEHLLFALKHEGTALGILMEAMRKIPASEVQDELRRTPTGVYARALGFLWEAANGPGLDASGTAGHAHPLFDPERYVTGPAIRNPRWRVDFNGLGSIRYCATVERTPALKALLEAGVLQRTQDHVASLGSELRDRILAWAYMDETQNSYAIERETPSEERAKAFVALLHQAHEKRPLSEHYLSELQQAAISNPFHRAVAFRHEQNWLQGPGRGAPAVSYVPPPPAIVGALMIELMDFANAQTGAIEPLVAAAVVKFGFVFLHPFMDGNGRVSRFLYHQTLCRTGALPNGLLLPVSIAMKKHEAEYMQALRSYSRPLRELWRVGYIDEGNYTFDYRGDGDFGVYRYWDATACVEFGCRMAEQALAHELQQETDFLIRFDRISRAVGEAFDIRGSTLATLVTGALKEGRVSQRRRDQFAHEVPASAFERIEEALRDGQDGTSTAAIATSRGL
ncbi:MAG: Fic family protein [Xanthomonadaceae bacterium]|nr:Fic family protein [Xanthomonadaceae bacterium]